MASPITPRAFAAWCPSYSDRRTSGGRPTGPDRGTRGDRVRAATTSSATPRVECRRPFDRRSAVPSLWKPSTIRDRRSRRRASATGAGVALDLAVRLSAAFPEVTVFAQPAQADRSGRPASIAETQRQAQVIPGGKARQTTSAVAGSNRRSWVYRVASGGLAAAS